MRQAKRAHDAVLEREGLREGEREYLPRRQEQRGSQGGRAWRNTMARSKRTLQGWQ